MNQAMGSARRGAQMGVWAAFLFVGLVLPAVLPDPAVADAHAICYRCFRLITVDRSPGSWGTDRSLRLLCRRCTNSSERCDEGIADLERQIAERLRALADLMAARAQCQGDPLCFEAWESAVNESRRILDILYDVLARMKAHCQAQDVGGGLGPLNSGNNPSSPQGSNAPRNAPTAAPGATASPATSGPPAGPVTPRSLSQQVRDRQVRMAPLSALAGRSLKPVSDGQLDIVGRHLAALQRVFEPVLAAAYSPNPAEPSTSLADPAATGVAQTWTLSDKGLAEPTLMGVVQGPSYGPPDHYLLMRVPRLNANAAAYAEALQHTEAEANEALRRQDAKKALQLLDHALYLATLGQAESREAEKYWVEGVRYLYQQNRYFNDHASTAKVTAEQAFGRWQDEVRKTGLPERYVADLRKAGWTDDQIAQHRDDLLALTPAELVGRQHQLAAACMLHVGDYTRPARPLEDGEWELASLRLLRLREPLAPADPAE
jgi:hypothetical protein